MPWEVSPEQGLNVVFDESCRLTHGSYFGRSALRLARSIDRLVAKEEPLFVVMHGHGDLARMLLIRRLRRRRVPMLHASDANALDERLRVGPRSIARIAYIRWILSSMDGYLAMGVGGRAFYRQLGREEVPTFDFAYEPDYTQLRSDDVPSSAEFLRRYELDASRRHFLYSGRLVPVKRVDLVVRAFASIADSLSDWDLVIAGQGPLRGDLELLVPADLRHRVRFIGFLQMEELRHAYKCCDVLLHASMREPWGLVINEAVAAGMAVIAMDGAGAALELVRHRINGYLVQPGSLSELRRAMQFVANSDVLASLRRNSARVLEDRRAGGDPIQGFRDAINHFAARAGH